MNAPLLRLQRMLRTDVVYAAKGGFWLSLGSAIGTLSSLIIVVAFANLAPKETYGSYKYLLAIAGTLAGFTLSGLGEALAGAAARGRDGTLRVLVRRAFQWNLLIAGAAFAGASWYFWHGSAMLGWALLAVGAFLPVTQSTGLYAAFLRGRKLFRTSAAYNVVRTVIPAAAMIAALTFFQEHPAALVAAFMGSSALTSHAAYRSVLRGRTRNDDVEPSALRFGAHVSLLNALGSAAANLDKIVIFQAVGAAPTAVYALAQAFPEQIDAVVSNVRTLALPQFAGQTVRSGFAPMLRKTAIIFFAMIPLAGVAMLVTPLAFRSLFPAYMDAVPYALVLMAAQIPIGAAHLPFAFITAHHDIRGRAAAGVITPVVWIVSLLLLVRPYGLMGAAVAKLIAKSCGLILTIIASALLSRRVPTPPASS